MLNKIRRNKTLVSNFGYLGLIQLATIVLPLVTYPYLIKIMGLELWGKIVLAQVIVSYLVMVINFGFDTVATKKVSIYSEDIEEISKIASDVLGVKLIIFMTLGLVYFSVLWLIDINHIDKEMLIYSYSACIAELILPLWYFQGIEKMRNIAIINFISKSILVGIIFIAIKEQSQYYLVPLFNSVGAIIGALTGIVLMVKHGVKLKIPNWSKMTSLFKEGAAICFNRLLISLKNRLNFFIIASLLGPVAVAVFDIAVKLLNVFTSFVNVICRTIFPRYARNPSKTMIKKVIILSASTTTLLLLFNVFLIDKIMFYLIGDTGAEYYTAIILVIVSVPFMTVGNILGMVVLNGNSEYKYILKGTFYTLGVYFLVLGFGYLFGFEFSLYLYAYSILIIYIFECLYRMYICRAKGYI
ncbi:oligosaccharide flippase family protein [Vibrio lentus]|uniref:oligosaccharide flippase family protein n=1 Tax=Vibrio lentus TaxID=136468 RepID=UPI000CB52713|nr:oligosaccharide flippase family protein [Vibrio lentus]PMH92275.1 hypothetical protein BCU56_09760 [Vibrio lentus]